MLPVIAKVRVNHLDGRNRRMIVCNDAAIVMMQQLVDTGLWMGKMLVVIICGRPRGNAVLRGVGCHAASPRCRVVRAWRPRAGP